MPFYPSQTSFAGGEVSPRLYGEVTSEWYKRGVQFSENWLHLPQGPIRYRLGSEFLLHAASDTGIRLLPFNTIANNPVLANPNDLCLELTEGEARLLDSSTGVVQLTAAGQLVLNNDFALGTANWITSAGYIVYEWLGSQATVNMDIPTWTIDWDPSQGGTIHPPTPPATPHPRVMQKLLQVIPGPYRLQINFPPLSPVDISNGYDPRSVVVNVGTTAGAGDLYSSLGNYNSSLDVTVTVPGGAPVDIWIAFNLENPTPPAGSNPQMAKVSFPRFTGASSGPAIVTGLPWTDAMLPGIQYAQDIFYGMVLVHPLMPPQKVVYTGAAFTVAPITFSTSPPEWATNQYPSCVDIWQSRLWLANTPLHPTSLWASHVGDYTDMYLATPLSAADPARFTLASKGSIKWIRGKQSFLIGTDLHEDVIVSATQVVSSLDAQLIRQSGYGSAPVQAQEIGDQVLFISRDQIKLRALNFNFDTQAWTAHDISYFAQEITLPGIVDVAFVRDPDNTIFVLCTDGTMRMCTYDRSAEVVAWSRWRTVGSVKAICATIDPTGTTLWMAVNRNGMNFIEIIPAFTSQTPIYLDSYNSSVPTVYTPIGETTNRITIPCGHHLDGFTVGVLVDQTYLGQAVVVAGAVDIPYPFDTATTAIVGLPYTGTLKTLPLEGGVMYGTAMGLMKKRTKVFTRLLPGSNVVRINGQLPANRFPATPMSVTQPIPDDDWDWWVTNSDGWTRYARVTLTQDQPFQCQVAAIFGRAEDVQL